MNTASPTITPHKLTRGALYLIEGLLQKTEPFTTPVATRRAARTWLKIHKFNPAKQDDIDFEEQLIRATGDSDIQWAQRQVDRNKLWKAWQESEATINLTAKEVKLLVGTAIKWALKHRDKVWPENNLHVLSILEAFPDVCDDDDDEEPAAAAE